MHVAPSHHSQGHVRALKKTPWMLQVLRQSGTAKEKEWAKRIEPVSSPFLSQIFLARLFAEAAQLSIPILASKVFVLKSAEKSHTKRQEHVHIMILPQGFL